MKNKYRELSIIVPSYKEEHRIKKNIQKTYDYCNKILQKFEIIIIDDGSKDNTKKIISELQKKLNKKNKEIKFKELPKNQGKGFAIKTGFYLAKYKTALFMDADLSTPLFEINNFLKMFYDPKNTFDIIIGSRDLKTSNIKIKQPLIRRIISKSIKKLSKIVVPINIEDTQCGFKMFNIKSKEIVKKIKTKRFAFDMEILYLAKLNKLKTKEKGVTWKNTIDSKVRTIDGVKFFLDLIKIRFYKKNV